MADGNYATRAELATRVGSTLLGQLSDSDTALQDLWIANAEGMVDSHLAGRYATPVAVGTYTGAAAALKAVTLDLAEAAARGHKQPIADFFAAQWQRAVTWLEAIQQGKAALPGAVPPADSTARERQSRVVSDTPVYTRTGTKGV